MTLKPLLFLFLFSAMVGCAGPALKTHEEIRLMQTRVYDTKDEKKIMRGVIQVFDDHNMDIQKADADLGFIIGKRESHPTDMADRMTGPVEWEYTITVSGLEDKTRVRLKIKSLLPSQHRRMMNEELLSRGTREIESEEIYKEFFDGLDRAIGFRGTDT